jgi:hypothetical protein
MLEARRGNRQAICEICKLAIEEIQATTQLTDPNVISIIFAALVGIADGKSPDEAFGWSTAGKGRRKANSAFRNWIIRSSVHTAMREGKSRRAACIEVSRAAGVALGIKQIENLCKDVNGIEAQEMPEDIFPLTGHVIRRRRARK